METISEAAAAVSKAAAATAAAAARSEAGRAAAGREVVLLERRLEAIDTRARKALGEAGTPPPSLTWEALEEVARSASLHLFLSDDHQSSLMQSASSASFHPFLP
jgi:hypothetical protein